MKLLKRLSVLLPVLALSGCAELEKFANEAKKIKIAPAQPALPAKPALVESLDEVCKVYGQNSLRANGSFRGKVVTARAVVEYADNVQGDFFLSLTPIEARSVELSAVAKRRTDAMLVSKGQFVTVTGVITNITFGNVRECVVFLSDATF
ncbi:OB-fold protein [Herbaspirillum camelliae]|uniref:OB-fold protein n=1 Tax=Herbaspirillum camelliae TaxID=1892903 RepID=UPI000949EAC6|nr:hypothetical protein [Herbaspirillum camelliae]